MNLIPTLVTERLTLGMPDDRTFDAWAAFCATDRAKYFGGPTSPAEAWRAMAFTLGHWVLRGYGNFWVRETATGTPVGRIGLYDPHGWPEPELAYAIYAEFEGTGMAFEAATRVRQWAYADLGMTTLVSLIAPENTASQKLAARLGARFEADSRYPDGEACQIWRHPGPGAHP